jgi:hypothetical protein
MLVVATAPVEDAVLRDRVREHAGPDAEVRVVAPASDLAATPAGRRKDSAEEASECFGVAVTQLAVGDG